MLNKYLKGDPVSWLTDGSEPAVTYLVKKEILKEADEDRIYNDLKSSALNEYMIRNLVGGVLGNKKNIDLWHTGSVWFFLLAAESGFLHTEKFMKDTADYICEKIQLDNGGFTFGKNISQAVACRSGEMTYALIRSGFRIESVEKGIEWIKNNQRSDGGWLHCPVAGICSIMKLILFNKSDINLKNEKNENIKSCPVASYSCIKTLIILNREKDRDAIKRGVDFFVRNSFFMKKTDNLLCGNYVRFDLLGYPLMTQYDYLSGMIVASKSGYFDNSELFNTIIKRQNSDGSWNNENNCRGMIDKRKGKSRWTTLNALRLIESVINSENQFEKA